MATVLVGGTLATLSPRSLLTGSITVEKGRIAQIGTIPPDGIEETVDCRGKLIIPGNVCAHTHLYSALARGMPAPRQAPTNFPEILQFIWWRLDRALDEEGIRYSALAGLLDAVRSGTTCLVDHHASPSCIDGSLDIMADAFEQVGARGVLCYEVTDRGGREGRDAGLGENARFLREGGRPLVRGMVGAHASFTLEDGTLDALAAMASDFDTGIHIHVAEDLCDEEDSLRRCGKRTALRLEDAGILRDGTIAAHGVHLDSAELDAIHSRHSWLVHNCRSNMNNSVGRAPLEAFGGRCALGTDGIDGDMFAESRSAFFRAREKSLSVLADQITDMLARGADLVSPFFERPVGKLEAGALADLVVLNYDPPTPLTEGNLAWHWMFAMQAGQVDSVMIAGEWVVRKGEFLTVDEQKIRAEARAQAQRLWSRMEAL